MWSKVFNKVWRIPLLLALLNLFGLLAALLGTGAWYILSWLVMSVPLGVIGWKWTKAGN